MSFLLFLMIFQQFLHIPAWLQVAGRMHPMFLHFPIVLLLFSFLTLWMPAKKEEDGWPEIVRFLAALSAVVAAIMGMLLSLEDDRSGQVLQWHKWSGAAITLMGFLFYRYHAFFSNKNKYGKIFAMVAVCGIMLTGHFGAELTHGENYLFGPVTKEIKRKIAPDEALVFRDVIQPILERKCVTCHSHASRKGGLMMSDTAGLLAGGKTGPLFVAGNADLSLLLQRIHLPESDKKHMPPRSRPQLTYDEVVLLRTWVNTGVLLNKKLSTLPAQDTFRVLATRFLGPVDLKDEQPQYDFAAADEKKINALNSNYRVIKPQGTGSPALAVSFFGKYAYTKKALEELLPLKQQITELSLARMPAKDDDLGIVKQMPHLRKLNLNYTEISSKGLEELTGLKNLTEITLAGTGIEVKDLEKIMGLPKLTSVFIWDTKVDTTQLAAIRKKYKKVKIETGFADDGSVITALSPPVISLPTRVFDNTVEITVKHPFHGAIIRYSLDGTSPDSANGEIYKTPILLNSSVTFTARAFKKGWLGSSDATAIYLKRGVKPDSIELITLPDPKYKANAMLLVDEDLGGMDFGNGQWMGYQKNDAACYLYFNHATNVQQVLLNTLKRLDQHIFPPAKIEVWGGIEKNKLKLLGKITPGIPAAKEKNTLNQEKISFPIASVKVLKIIATPLKALPQWHADKGKPGWTFLSEIVVE
ncbi:hypothetical protein MMC2321_00467 [Chitinophaga sp. MM2321]